jgi:prephenate dehydrogenase
VRWQKVTLIGVGLLGGSLGMALRQRKLAAQVTGFVRRASSVRECQQAGAVDAATLDLGEAIEGADLVVLCTPVGQMRTLATQIAKHVRVGAIVTDVGSVKAAVVREVEKVFSKAGAHFIGSHPMAGSEKTGVAAARAGLYEGAVCVVTPARGSDEAALRKVENLWKSVGARVLRLSPREHDLLVSRSSHLPHVLAVSLVNFVLAPGHAREQGLLCANGFRDCTRIASGSPEMWKDIALANGKNISVALKAYIRNLRQLDRLLCSGKETAIAEFFDEGKRRRDAWRAQSASFSPE